VRIGVRGGGVLTDSATGVGRPLRSGAAYTVQPSGGGLRVLGSSGAITARTRAGLRVTARAGGAVTWDGRPYRGALVVTRSVTAVRVVNVLPVEQYLRGVVPAEMPSAWRPAALDAQATAARSYALRSLRPSAAFDVYADTRSQAYGGIAAEAATTDAAVARTAGVVVTYQGLVVPAYFAASDGGYTESVQNVWGGAAVPYLSGVPDPFDAGAPLHRWPRPRTFTGAQLGRLLRTGRSVVLVEVSTRGVSPRVRAARVDLASGGSIRLSGAALAADLGLPSTWFWVGQSDLPTPVEPGVSGGQGTPPAPPAPTASARGSYMVVTRITGSLAAARQAFARLRGVAPARQLIVRHVAGMRRYLVVAVRMDSAAAAAGARRTLQAWGIRAGVARARPGDPRPFGPSREFVLAPAPPDRGGAASPGGLVPPTPVTTQPGARPAP
jgi:stage II sporulation protein D